MSVTTGTLFTATLLKPKLSLQDPEWAFVVLPIEVSNVFPRRGRTTANVIANGHQFQQMLEPDGQKSHWLKISEPNLSAASITYGDEVTFSISPIDVEPEPKSFPEFQQALDAQPLAKQTWAQTTAIAKVDWLHWISSAKQEKTRIKRIQDAVDMLSQGKKRVCCFDSSGFYSKAFTAPNSAE